MSAVATGGTLRFMVGPARPMTPAELADTRARYEAYQLGEYALSVYDDSRGRGMGPAVALCNARWWARRSHLMRRRMTVAVAA